MQNSTKKIIESYYDYFNKQEMKSLLNLLSDNVEHDINQGEKEIGKEKFSIFLDQMNKSYQENIKDIHIMVSEDGKRAAAEFITSGTYLTTAEGLPEATGQKYELPCGAFFAIEDGKISRVTVYYNLNEWIRQVGM